MGHDSAVKPTPPQKDTGPQGILRHPGSILSAPAPGKGTPEAIEVGGIDWRFADPLADVVAGFNLSGLAGSPVAIRVISQLGAKQDLSQVEMERIFEGLSGVNQIALSVRNNRTVVMVTGRAADSAISGLPPGWKATPVADKGMLLGQAEAVDEAAQRIARKAPLSELASLADQQQTSTEFWALGSGSLLGEQAASAGVKRFALAVSIEDNLTSDQAYELNRAPEAATARAWPANIGGATIDGNVVHVTTAMAADDVPEMFGPIAASPLGQNLGALVKVARYLPGRVAAQTDHTKPVIYGLDDGPKEVRQ